MKRKNIPFIIVLILLVIALISAVAVALVIRSERDEMIESYSTYRYISERKVSGLEENKESLNAEIAALEEECAVLKGGIASLEDQLEELEISFSNKDELYKELKAEIEKMNQLLSEKEDAIEKLKSDIDRMSVVYSVDIGTQVSIINQLEELLESGAPLRIPVEEEDIEKAQDGEETEAETEAETEETTSDEDATDEDERHENYPNLAVYYYDINNGYEYSYNGDYVFDSASLIKAPMALSILQSADEYYKAEYDEALAQLLSDSELLEKEEPEESEEIPKYTGEEALTITEEDDPYTLGEVFTYEEEFSMPGSGVIKEDEEGKEYTFAELFGYMLKYSDNVAYSQIRQKYGFGYLRDYAYANKLTSMYETLSNMSARDAGKIMLDIYEYSLTETAFSDLIIESLNEGMHTVMISRAVYPKDSAHKYGWALGAYHDMAIVYDENPYIVVFMSDLDQGGKEVDEYIWQVIGLIDELHDNFYKMR